MKIQKLAVILLLLGAPVFALGANLPDAPHVVVSARGEVEAVPDMAQLRLQISDTAKTSAPAKQSVDRRVQAVLDVAAKLGLAEEDITASQIRVFPDYQWRDGERILLGQRVERRVDLTLRDLSRYGQLVDGLLAAGIDELGNVEFDLSNRDALLDRATERAIAEAKRQAEQLAEGFGGRVKGVYHVQKLGVSAPRPERVMMAMDAKAGAAEMPVSFGTETLSVNLNAVFLLK